MPTGHYERYPGLQADVAAGKRRCSKCKETKPLGDFSPDRRSNPNGVQSKCKKCHLARMQYLRSQDPEKYRRRAAEQYQKHRAKKYAYGLKWRTRNRDRVRGYALKGRYGLTPEDVERMRADQDHRCGICDRPLKPRAHTDHDHKTGRVRGILCGGCNIVLGHFEKPGFYDRLVAYLARHDARQTDAA